MSITISNLQMIKLNDSPIKFKVSEVDYPIAPLVFAEKVINQYNTFRVRMVVYVPSEANSVPSEPYFNNDGKPVTFYTEDKKELVARSCVVDYDYSSESIPEEYFGWSINFEYSLGDLMSVDYFLTHLTDIDPKTSRGTVTTVQQS